MTDVSMNVFPMNLFHIGDLILFAHQFCRHVEHFLQGEICCIHNGILIVLENLSHALHSSSKPWTFPKLLNVLLLSLHSWTFCLLRTWSFTLFTNSATSLPMMKFVESAASWELILSSCPDPSWSLSPYLTDCASPTRRVSPWWGQIRSPHSKKFYQVAWSIVRRNLTFPLLRRPSTVMIQFWITFWRKSIRLPWSIIYNNCEREGIVGGDEGPVGGLAQVVSHGVKVVGVHGEEGKEKDEEVQGEKKEKSNNSGRNARRWRLKRRLEPMWVWHMCDEDKTI